MKYFYLFFQLLIITNLTSANEINDHLILFLEDDYKNLETLNICSSQPSDLLQELKKWKRAGFKDTDIQWIGSEEIYEDKIATSFTHGINMSVVMGKNIGWTREDILERIEKTKKIYEQCGVKILNVKLVQTILPKNLSKVEFSDEKHPLHATKLTRKTPDSPKPIIYFIEDFINPTATELGYAVMDLASSKKSSKTNSVFISRKGIEDNQWLLTGIEKERPGFEIMAHELTHLLGPQPGHSSMENGFNLMAEAANFWGPSLTQEQCDKIKKSILVKEL